MDKGLGRLVRARTTKRRVKMEITKEKFQAYEMVRDSGKTNMWDTAAVEILSGGVITSNEALEVIKRYGEFNKKWPEVRK
jgi:hypothetical protein